MNNSGKFIDFIITQKCTYRCKYCSQSKTEIKNQNHATNETIEAFYNLLDQIEKDFEITITGGEAILHPKFYEIISNIKEKEFKINLISNFSFDIDIYNKIFNILGNSLNRFDLSFHLDEIQDFDKTLEKLKLFIQNKPKTTETVLLIPIYNLTNEKENQIQKLIELANKNKINYDFQHIRLLNKYQKNTPQEDKYFTKEKIEKSYSKLCLAGSKSIVIYENGEAYRCYSSRFLKTNYLGNIKNKHFKLNNCAKVCTQKYCTCPKPKIYNQITEKKASIKACISTLYNYINLPFLIFKNKEIIKTKLKQYVKIRH